MKVSIKDKIAHQNLPLKEKIKIHHSVILFVFEQTERRKYTFNSCKIDSYTSLTKQNNFTQETNSINGSNSIADQKRVLSGVSSHRQEYKSHSVHLMDIFLGLQI